MNLFNTINKIWRVKYEGSICCSCYLLLLKRRNTIGQRPRLNTRDGLEHLEQIRLQH